MNTIEKQSQETVKKKRKSKIYRILAKVVFGMLIVTLLAAGFIYWYDKTGQRPDASFDTTVKIPTYITEHPRLLFDVAHSNYHTPSGRYHPLAELLRHDGYSILENTKPFGPAILDSAQVLVIANAMGPDGHEGRAAFTIEEDSVVVQWVRLGGSLLLIADHVPFGSTASILARSFGVEMYLAFARDDKNSNSWDNERLIFSPQNGLLTVCPITQGRNLSEHVCNVQTFTGQSLSVPPGATPVLRMGDNSYDWESSKVRQSAKGHAQCVAMNFGKGRVVVLGEAGVLSAQIDPLGFRMGMNYPGSCDRQFALNIMHWLSRVLN
jgi:hypothetical protein